MDYESKFKLIPDWFKQKLSCYFCGSPLGVKYVAKAYIAEEDREAWVSACSKCVYDRYVIKGDNNV